MKTECTMKYHYSKSTVAIFIRQIFKSFTSTGTAKGSNKNTMQSKQQLMLPASTTTEAKYTDTMANDYGSTF